MATVRQLNSGRWRCEVYCSGVRRSKVLDTKARAAAWGEDTERQLAAGDTGRRFDEAANRYLRDVMPHKRGAKRETFRLRAIMEHFGAQRLAELDAPQISAWRDKRRKEVSTWSVLREANILKALFHVARDEWHWMTHDPFRGVRMPKDPPPRHQRWRWQEIRRVLRFLGYQRGKPPETKYQEVALAFVISLATALRAGEVLQVGPGAIRGRVLVVRSKTEDRAEVPLTRRGLRLCSLAARWTIDEALRDALFRKACKACLIRGLRFHDARASALTWLSRKVDILTLSRISRHKDLRILQRVYYRETAEEIAKRI